MVDPIHDILILTCPLCGRPLSECGLGSWRQLSHADAAAYHPDDLDWSPDGDPGIFVDCEGVAF